jgi:predicted dehydrogenase
MRIIRWGIIGCGDVTEVKSGPALQKATNSALVAVMRRDAAKAADYAARHGVPRWYADGRALIADPGIDALYVATPPSSHEQYAVMAAEAGKPIYVEKPMARTHDECQRMIAAAASAGVPLFVAYYRRRLPMFLRAKQLIDDGAIGDVRLVSITLYQRPHPNESDRANLHWHVIPEIAGAGRFLDLASHMLDILDFLLGPIAEVSGRAANHAGLYDAEDIVTAHWAHQSGVLGTGIWCFTSCDKEDRIEIIGTKGVIAFPCFIVAPLRLQTSEGTREFSEPPPVHIQQPFIQTIVDELNGVGHCPSTGDTAARTSWVMDQMLQGWRQAHHGF